MFYIDMARARTDLHPLVYAVARQLAAERAAQRFSVRGAASAADIGVSTVQRIEDGVRAATTEQLARLCGIYRISVSELIARAERRLPAQTIVTQSD